MSDAADRREAAIRARPGAVAVGCVLATLLIGLGDLVTGPYLVFATFYLIPVAAAAWYVRREVAIGIGLLAALLGMASTAIDPGAVTAPVIAWNALFRFLTYLAVALLVDAQHRSYDRIHALASTDPLTGLLNRRRFYELVEAELARAQRTDGDVALVYLDVDGLKGRNDTYGHEAGDTMLSQMASITVEAVRAIDLVARVGGDEFCVLLPMTDRAAAESAVARIFDALALADPLPIRCSAGIVAGRPDPTVDVETLVRRADHLMIEAKRSGKGTFRASDALGAGVD